MNDATAGQFAQSHEEPHAALLRAARLSHPDWENVGHVTFDAVAGAAPWASWKKDIFTPVLRPRLETMLAACSRGDGRAVEACDRELDGLLAPILAERSRLAGKLLATAFTVPNGEKFWRRTREHIIAGGTPGHLATTMVLRASAFHLPPALVIGSYVLAEARGAMGLDQLPLCVRMVDDCLAGGSETFALRAA